ncbi:MAG: metallophosphoesterase family protein [Planctomycetota bacterium]
MLVAVLGDIHSNLPALEQVLKSVRQEKVDKIYCTGDIVGYGPYPAECIEIIQDNNINCVAGNHDFAVIDMVNTSFFTDSAKEVIEYTKSELSDSDKEFLENLPLYISDNGLNIVHSSFSHPELFEYIIEPNDIIECFMNLGSQIGFFGHTHFFIIYLKKSEDINDYVEISENILHFNEEKLLINSGTVGQPRDGNVDSGYLLLDTDKKVVFIKRIPYDYRKTIEEMKRKNFPLKLTERLLVGI